MSQERWDVVLRFLDGPLSYQGDVVCRGPVVRMGASPGPGGLLLDGYRGLDNRQAVITAYDGGTVAIAPVGTNQVRVAPHENVDWNEIQTLRGPVHLSPGSVFHLGAPGRGATVLFVECRRLGIWIPGQILSEAAQVDSGVQPVRIESLDTQRGIPRWLVPASLITAMLTVVGLTIPLVSFFARDRTLLEPVEDGDEVYKVVETADVRGNIEQSLLAGMEGAFEAFVIAPNAKAADWEELKNPSLRDEVFYRYVILSMKQHASARNFWKRLSQIDEDYAYVVDQLTKAQLPTVFAAIPYRESGYKSRITSPVCAEGWWQFMPETGRRVGLEIRDCKLGLSTWSPTQDFTPRGVLRNAPYVSYNSSTGSARCKISGCAVDERTSLTRSTAGALELMREAWDHPTTQESGAAVQITILSHNAGFDDAAHDGKKPRPLNMLTAYNRYLTKTGKQRAPDFYGANIKCDPAVMDPHVAGYYSTTCDGYIPNQTQHYGYSIVAQHLLAVCYYAKNFPSDFPKSWENYLIGDGYCKSINVPDL